MASEQVAERRRQVRELTRQGHSAGRIAAALGVSERTVQRDRKAAGVAQCPSEPLTPRQIELARHLLEEGCSYQETAKSVGCALVTLRKHFPGMGWTYTQGGAWGQYMRNSLTRTQHAALTTNRMCRERHTS